MANPSLVWDGFTDQKGGMNIGPDGSQIGALQYRLLVNGTARGGFAKQRPGFKRLMEVHPGGVYFQHGGWLRTRNGHTFLIAVINGHFYRVDPLADTVVDFTPLKADGITLDTNPYTLMCGWSIPGGAEGFWVYQDGQSPPLITDGSVTRRALPGEIKPGRVIAYANGRIWYSLPDGLSFRATDLVGNPESGTAPYNYKDSILKETENTYLNEGGDFSVPMTAGPIRAMVPLATLDESQGQGPLQVFCENGGFSVNAPVDRTIWKDLQYPIITHSLINSGFSGAQNAIHVNGDVFGRSPDGLRSFIVARRNFRDWGNTPQSFEVSEIIKYDQPDLLQYGGAAVFDNRLFFTCQPNFSGAGIYHRGLVAMDLAPISSLLSQATPVYDGIWTGLNILSIQQTDIGTFMFVLGFDGVIELWQMTTDEVYDDEVGRVIWTLVPRTLFVDVDTSGRPTWLLKELETARFFPDNLHGNVDFSLSWRPDQYPCWKHWHTWYECAPMCPDLGCDPPAALKQQYRALVDIPTPPDICAEGIPLPLRNFYHLNIRLDVTGPARVRGMRVGAHKRGEPAYDPHCGDPVCVDLSCCDFDMFSYTVTGSHYQDATGGSGSSGASGGSGTVIPDPFIPPQLPPDVPIIGEDEPEIPEVPPPDVRPDAPPPPIFVNPPVPTDRPNVPFEPGEGEGVGMLWLMVTSPSGTSLPVAYGSVGTVPPDGLPDSVYAQWHADLSAYFEAERIKPLGGDLALLPGQSLVKFQSRWEDFSGADDTFNAPMVYEDDTYTVSKWIWRLIVEYVYTL